MEVLQVNWTNSNSNSYYLLELDEISKNILNSVLIDMKDDGNVTDFYWTTAPVDVSDMKFSDLNADLTFHYFSIDCNYPYVPCLLGNSTPIDNATKDLIDAVCTINQRLALAGPEAVRAYLEVIQSFTEKLVKMEPLAVTSVEGL